MPPQVLVVAILLAEPFELLQPIAHPFPVHSSNAGTSAPRDTGNPVPPGSRSAAHDARLAAEEIIRRAERGLALTKLSPEPYVGSAGQARSDAYAMTDCISDEDFEEALAEAQG